MLRRGNPRAVRLLDVTGVLERGVPTVAAAVARRRADPAELDPVRVLRFPIVARLDELLVDADPVATPTAPGATRRGRARGARPRRRRPRRRRTPRCAGCSTSWPSTTPASVEHLLTAARLLRAGAGDLDGYDRAELLQLASRIGSAATLLVRPPPRRRQHDRRHAPRPPRPARTSSSPTCSPIRTCSAATPRSLADGTTPGRPRRWSPSPRRSPACEAAPDGYLLAHEPDELARQARLVEPLPPRGTIRVAVSPEGTPDHWIVDIACRDTDGLLAHLAGALNAAGCDIAAATVATWPDGAAVDTFLVRAAVRPSARRLADADGGSARPTASTSSRCPT